jgi:hypothetical protein
VSGVDAVLDDLYGLPLEEFTAARNAASNELRKQGLADEAAQIKALKKPSVAAWALNQLGRRHPRELAAFVESAQALRDAQLGGRDLGAATKAERDALERLVALAREDLGGGSAAVVDRVRQSLTAAAVDDPATVALQEGRLGDELEPAGFGSLSAHAPAAPPAPAKPRPKPPQPNRKAIERAKRRLGRAQDERERAIAQLAAAEEELAAARSALEEAERG